MDVFTANISAENLYSRGDVEGNSYAILEEIIDHKSDGTAVSKDDGYETTTCRHEGSLPGPGSRVCCCQQDC